MSLKLKVKNKSLKWLFQIITDVWHLSRSTQTQLNVKADWTEKWCSPTSWCVRTILMRGSADRLSDSAGDGSTFREIRWLAIWILQSLKSTASLILHWQTVSYWSPLITWRPLSKNTHISIYLTELLHPHKPVRSLRSMFLGTLSIPRSKLKHRGDRLQ